MLCINFRRILETVGTAGLVLLLLLPMSLGTNDDVSLADAEDDCGDASERGWQQGDRTAHGRPCGGGRGGHGGGTPPHESDAASNSSGVSPKPSREQWISRLRRKETWKNVLLYRLWHARRNSSAVGTQIVPRHLQTTTNLTDFKALLERAQTIIPRGDEQDAIASHRVYLPHCSGPRNFTGSWNDGTNFRLYFNVESAAEATSHRPSSARETKVVAAVLHLKRKTTPTAAGLIRVTPTTGRVTGRPSVGESPARGGQRFQARKPKRTVPGVNDSSGSDGDSDQLKVTVYLNSRPTRRNRPETRLVIRTVSFPRNSSGWVRINLTSTVEDWVKRPQRNFGIQVTVLKHGGTEELPPGEYFDGFNCIEDQVHPAPVEFPLWTLDENLVDLEMNLTQTCLDLITTEVAKPRSRHQRDLSSVHSAPSALHRD